MLRQLVTGEMTRPATSWEELEAILTGTTAAGAELVPGMSPGWNAVLKKCLALDESARYASATQLREDLERVLHDFSPIHARMNPSIAFGRRRSTASTDTTMTRPLVIETEIAGSDETVLVAAPASQGAASASAGPSCGAWAPRMPWPILAGILAPVFVGVLVLAWWLGQRAGTARRRLARRHPHQPPPALPLPPIRAQARPRGVQRRRCHRRPLPAQRHRLLSHPAGPMPPATMSTDAGPTWCCMRPPSASVSARPVPPGSAAQMARSIAGRTRSTCW